MKEYFPLKKYKTPENARRSIFAKIAAIRTLIFYYAILKIVLKAGRAASKGLYDDEQWAMRSYDAIVAAENCGCDVEIIGLENISDTEGPAVFIGNHMSVFETFALACTIMPNKRPAFIIKKELVEYPFFGKVMKAIKHIAVSRKNPKDDFKEVMEQGCSLISQGYSPVVFPQATRMREFVPEKFNSIGVKLARKAAVPVIPIALKTDFWGNGRFIKDFGPIGRLSNKIFIEFAPAIKVEGSGKDEHERIVSFIKGRLAEWEKL
ncbi:MAG TPA: lysophospholipid acyltransferase family protein [Victivallales bacterium]|nr:lysophospholipid acyltransferase family protein [Victivallales bacterium]